MKHTIAAAGLAIVAVLASATAVAETWTGGTGNWNDVGSWSPFEPDSFSFVTIDNGGTVQVNSVIPDIPIEIKIASTGGSTGTLDVLANGDLATGKLVIGDTGVGAASATSGLLRTTGSLFVGSDSNTSGVGTLNVNSGGAAVSGDDFQMGRNGTGTLNFNTGAYGTGIYTVVGKFGSGTWNHAGGVYAQGGSGDVEIGDGGKPGQFGTPGPREGTINLSGGAIYVDARFAIGNRIGSGTVNISGGGLAITGDGSGAIGDSRSNNLDIGRGADWTPTDVLANSVTGNDVALRVIGDQSVIAVGLDLTMDLNNVFESSTLVAQITGETHTPILVGRNALISNGTFAVELSGYAPKAGDQWSIIQTNVDLTDALTVFDAIVTAENVPAYYATDGSSITVGDAIQHNNNAFTENGTDPSYQGVVGPFLATDFSGAPLGANLEFQVEYLADEVLLKVVSTGGPAGDFNSDGNVDGADFLIWQRGGSPNGATAGDLAAWESTYGTMTPMIGAVPEPAACGLAAVALLATLGLRRRQG